MSDALLMMLATAQDELRHAERKGADDRVIELRRIRVRNLERLLERRDS